MKTIEGTQDPVAYRMMETRARMQEQLATVTGVVVGIVVFILVLVCLRAYKELALLLGTWKEPSWVDVAVLILSSPLLIALVGAVVRWVLIYRWIMKEG